MDRAQLRAIAALPLNVLGTVPALLLWWSDGWRLASPAQLRFWLALGCFAAGLLLMARTIRLFSSLGEGTLAPWNPTRRFVAVGVYRYVRNPMISGVLLNLLGEALLFQSVWILGWLAVFFTANAVYIPFSEEPGLEARFGEEYRRYKENVPRWVPRTRPWEG